MPWLAVSVEPTVADPLIRGSAVLVGLACVTAPLPAGSASTVASDASAAAASVQSAPIFRVVRIACPFVECDDTGLARIRQVRTTFLRKLHSPYESIITMRREGGRYPRPVARFSVRGLRLRPGQEHHESLRLVLDPLVLGGETYHTSPPETPAELVVQRAATGDIFRLASLDAARRAVHAVPRSGEPHGRGRRTGVRRDRRRAPTRSCAASTSPTASSTPARGRGTR